MCDVRVMHVIRAMTPTPSRRGNSHFSEFGLGVPPIVLHFSWGFAAFFFVDNSGVLTPAASRPAANP